MSIFEPQTWRAYTKEEVARYLKAIPPAREPGERKKERAEDAPPTRQALILQSTISPLDLYAYLKARFGYPNGFQTFLAKDDSDNLFHWDYLLDSDGQRITFTGATQEVHVWHERELTDAEWHTFIDNLKGDFRRVGREKSEVIRAFEKWYIFPNRYLAIANRCAELYHKLQGSLPRLKADVMTNGMRSNDPDFMRKRHSRSAWLTNVTEACIELPILTPVLFETFIGLIVAFMTKPEVKANQRVYQAFTRSNLDVKIFDLAVRCQGFEKPVAADNEVMAKYWQVVSRRNDIIHGNIDPVRDATEIVYFDGKRPLYPAGGDRVIHFWQGIISQYNPEQVLTDYLTAHEFMAEILEHMSPPSRFTMKTLMNDTQPGWDDKRRKVGRLFPDHLTAFFMESLRYDGDLEPRGAERAD